MYGINPVEMLGFGSVSAKKGRYPPEGSEMGSVSGMCGINPPERSEWC
jgi:hypothetical protein